MLTSTAPVKPSNAALSLSLAVSWSVVCYSGVKAVLQLIKTVLWLYSYWFFMLCCIHIRLQEDDTVVNVQCGYQTLNSSAPQVSHPSSPMYNLPSLMLYLPHLQFYVTSDLIHTTGCVDAVENLFSDNLTVILGVGVGLLVFQLFNIMLAGGELLDGGGVWGVSLTVFICRSGIGHPQGESSYEGCEAERKVVASLNDLLFSYLHVTYVVMFLALTVYMLGLFYRVLPISDIAVYMYALHPFYEYFVKYLRSTVCTHANVWGACVNPLGRRVWHSLVSQLYFSCTRGKYGWLAKLGLAPL